MSTPITDIRRTPEERASFLEERRKGIGGSDAAAVVGLNPYSTALDVYKEKVGEGAPKPVTPAMQRGTYLEPVAVDLFVEVTGRKVRRQPQRVHPSYDFIIGNIDRQILQDAERPTGLLEVKCPGIRTFLKIQHKGLPAHWAVQGQHYLGVYDYDYMSFAVFNADLWKLIHFDIERDDAVIEALFAKEIDFWREHVERRVPPPLSLEGIELPAVEGKVIERTDPEWAEAIESLRQAKTLSATAESVEEAAKARVKELMGAFGVAEGAGARVYWKPGQRTTFDRKALEAARPLDRMKVFNSLAEFFARLGGTDAKELAELNQALGANEVDFAAYEKKGAAFDSLRPYWLKAENEEDE
ncbi:MAG TPA: YqaJ viral recombinase family protein [Gemmatimonadales bacterium]|nr:YqaJ viral recombinase family protein [Gemmatimonadales bacterium]